MNLSHIKVTSSKSTNQWQNSDHHTQQRPRNMHGKAWQKSSTSLYRHNLQLEVSDPTCQADKFSWGNPIVDLIELEKFI